MNKKIISMIVAGIIIENILVIGGMKAITSNANKSLVISGKVGSETVAIDPKAIANNYRNQLDILALKDITGDTNIDKEVQDEMAKNIKSMGGDQKFLQQLKNSNVEENSYIESLEYNLLLNKAIDKTNIKISDSEAQKALKDGHTDILEKELKIYISPNKQSILNLQDQLKNQDKITLPKDVQDGSIKVGRSNSDYWSIVGNLPDGKCSGLLTVGANNILIYNISSISEDEQLKNAVDNLKRQRAIAELNKKIDAERNTFTYQIK